MGLDIYSKSEKGYHFSYSGIHYIRYMAYKAQGGVRSYIDWHDMQKQAKEPDWAYAHCLLFYPNLYWHSDCEGTYTLRGKLDFAKGTLLTGNSKKLLWELTDIKEMLTGKDLESIKLTEGLDAITDKDWYVFNMFYDLVKDVVENHDGRIEFC